jgi:hypothetical protein
MILDGEHFSITAFGCNEKLTIEPRHRLQPKAEPRLEPTFQPLAEINPSASSSAFG